MSQVNFKCPHCGSDLSVDERVWGSRVRCPDCNRFINLNGPKPYSFLNDVSETASSAWKVFKPGLTYLGGQLIRSLFGG